jgi:hypothetical protein
MPPEEGSKRTQPPGPSEEADREAKAPRSRAKGDQRPRRKTKPTPAADRKDLTAVQAEDTKSAQADVEAEATPATAVTATKSKGGQAPLAGATPRPVEAGIGAPEAAWPQLGLTVSDVRVLHEGAAAAWAAAFRPKEAFTLQVHFRLRGTNARTLTSHKSPFDARVYAEDLNTGTRKLLAVDSANLVEDKVDYAIEMPASGLASGQHRLLTLVAIHAPINMVEHRRGPVLNITYE